MNDEINVTRKKYSMLTISEKNTYKQIEENYNPQFLYETKSNSFIVARSSRDDNFYVFIIGRCEICLGCYAVFEEAENEAFQYIAQKVVDFGQKQVSFLINENQQKEVKIDWKKGSSNTLHRFGVEEFCEFIDVENKYSYFALPEKYKEFGKSLLAVLNDFQFEFYILPRGLVFCNNNLFLDDLYFSSIKDFVDFLFFIAGAIVDETIVTGENTGENIPPYYKIVSEYIHNL